MVDDRPNVKINNDEDASKAISDFISNNDIRYFEPVREYVENNTYSNIKLEIDGLSDLDISINGESLLDFIIDHYHSFNYELIDLILDNIVIIKHIIDRGNVDILNNLSEKALSFEYEDGKTLFEYLLEHDILTDNNIRQIYSNLNYFDKLREKDINLLKHLNTFALEKYKIGDITAIEYLFQNNLVDGEIVKRFFHGEIIYNLCIKYNRDDLLEYLHENILKIVIDGKTVLEHLLDKGIIPNEKYYMDKTLIKILLDHKIFNIFISDTESSLLEKVDGDKTVLEILLDNGVIPTTTYLRKKESLLIFLKKGIFDIIPNYDIDTITSLYDLNNTFLDYILDRMDEGLDFPLSKISTYSENASKVAKFYVTIARRGYIKNLDTITENSLTKNNGKLLKALLDEDKDLTLNVIIPPHIKEKMDVAVLLRLNGVEQKDVKIDLHSMNIVDEYFEKFNSDFRNRELDEESKSLIEEFKRVMLSDDLSDPVLLDAMITSYTYLLSTHNILGEKELRKLIEIKRNDPKFSIVRNKENSFYREYDNSINLENVGLNTLNHETGHALYHNLTDVSVPNEYENILYEIRNNPETISKVSHYSLIFQETKRRVEEYVDEKYMKDYHMSEEELSSLDEFLSKQKEENKKTYLEKGYDEEAIDTILSRIFTKEEYIEQDKRIKREELIDAILRSEYGAFITIGDILDSIYIGKFKSGQLRNNYHNVILGGYGHGMAYYERGIRWSFDETVANFSAIMKSEDSRIIMSYLKDIVGERFINCISEYYINNIVESTKDLSVKEDQSL